MHAQDVKLIDLFHGSVRFLMPMFQRPYVWGEEREWAPLWQDIRHQAEMVLAAGHYGDAPSHFLGAIVTEPRATFGKTEHVVIDGQQRLTTLQIVLDAAERVVDELGNPSDAADLRVLILNQDSQGKTPDDETRYKVWPTNRDRDAFAAAMEDVRPVPAKYAESRLVKAHNYFTENITEWAQADGEANAASRLGALVRTLRTQLVLVGISLEQGDNAQAIFETLNYLGAPLLAADLIKNHLFQRAQKEHRNLAQLHKHYWAGFDGDGNGDEYWREKVRQGRLNRPRIDLFLTHWLVMKLGRELPSDRIFAEFRDRISKDVVNVEDLMKELHTDAMAYRKFMDAPRGTVEETFRYRVLDVLDANAVMPAVLWVIAHDVPADERQLALESLESWLVRRAILRLGSKDLNHITIDLIKRLRGAEATQAGSVIREFLVEQTAPTRLWPDDVSIVEHLQAAPFYKQAKRSVNRMLLEAAEEMLRRDAKAEEVSCPRDLSVEHVMPQKWTTHWPLGSDDPLDVERRDLMVQTLGNLTLVTPGHNSALSNSAWLAEGAKGKREYLLNNAVLKLNAELYGHEDWTEERIAVRGSALAQLIVRTWRRPAGGPSTTSLLSSPSKVKRKTSVHRATYEIHGPGFCEEGLPRRIALRQMITRVNAAGLPMETVREALNSSRLRRVEGIHEGQELFEQLVAQHGINPEAAGQWFLNHPIHESGHTWVLAESWGRHRTHASLDKLSKLADGFGWSTTARVAGAAWSLEDVMDHLEEAPELAAVVTKMSSGVEALGGRVRGTAAQEPSVALGVPGVGGEVWPFTFYAGRPERPVSIGFHFAAAPAGAEERFLGRIAPLLPSLDAEAVRASEYRAWPSVSAGDLLLEGVPEALAQATEEYLGDGDTSRWWCIHNDELSGQTLQQGGFVSLGWDELGDLNTFSDREALKSQLRIAYPGEKEGAYTNWTAMLTKFAHELKPGDYVISPVKASRTVDIGAVRGSYWFDAEADRHKHRLPVEWLVTGIGRDEFSTTARHEIGGALALFRVRRTATEFADQVSMGVGDPGDPVATGAR
ncbi:MULTISPECIES: GmrSD restriction endonuclease domain-containing protein [unclassified Luteococcus]|uniref:GmrSD restriction endonuclease domain-containing protein n=1 Tax=unclassified Luteococcus TaxID=2639923 RepID=UPI00313F2CC2